MALGAGPQALTVSSSSERGTARGKVQVPSFFLCPIHFEIMRDPVTLSTGMTYDRASIEKWLEAGHNTCPTTNQVLESYDLIPNHTLRRAIQNWCDANKGAGVDRIPSPRKAVEFKTVQTLLHTIGQCADASSYHDSLKKLYAIAEGSGRNRKLLKESGAVPVLAEVLTSLGPDDIPPIDRVSRHSAKGLEYAVATIGMLHLDDDDRVAMAEPPTLTILSSLLATGSARAKIGAAEVIHSVCGEDERLKSAVGNHPGAIKGLVAILRDDKLTPKETKLGLRCLLSLSLPKKNRVIAIESRAVNALVELIPRSTENKRNVEYSCAIWEVLANCAEGREAITNHPFAIPRMVDSLLGVSNQATEHAVGALLVVISLASNRSVINIALRAGAFTKLLMILPSDCSQRAKTKARDTLKLLNEVWGTYTSRPEDDTSIMIERGSVRQRPHFNAES